MLILRSSRSSGCETCGQMSLTLNLSVIHALLRFGISSNFIDINLSVADALVVCGISSNIIDINL